MHTMTDPGPITKYKRDRMREILSYGVSRKEAREAYSDRAMRTEWEDRLVCAARDSAPLTTNTLRSWGRVIGDHEVVRMTRHYINPLSWRVIR